MQALFYFAFFSLEILMRNAKCVVRNEGGGAQLIKRRKLYYIRD